jgi:hypothetical protein
MAINRGTRMKFSGGCYDLKKGLRHIIHPIYRLTKYGPRAIEHPVRISLLNSNHSPVQKDDVILLHGGNAPTAMQRI